MKDSTKIDPVTTEVIRGMLESVTEEMQETLVKTSHSMLITEGRDCTAAVFDREGRTVAQATSVPVHLGVLVELGRRFAKKYPAGDARPGDLYITNDPYAGGTHMPDIAIVAPVFHLDELVGYTATMCHHRDIGGYAPGSVNIEARDIHAEGLRLPMIRVADGGPFNDSVMSMILANSRTPDSLLGDLSAQMAACRTGVERLKAVFERWSVPTVYAAMNALMDYAERMTRLAIEKIPDGDYTFSDCLDDDGLNPDSDPVVLRATMKVRGSEVIFDFAGTAPQVRSAINNVDSSTCAAVYYAVRTLIGDQVPNNDGCYRPIVLDMPEGSIVNCSYPAPVAARGISLKRIDDVVLGAMARALPEKMTAGHSGQYTLITAVSKDPVTNKRNIGHLGGPYAGGHGARPTKDGMDVNSHGCTNGTSSPIEIGEAKMPILFRNIELWTDSGGAGRWRGGLGFRAEVEWRRGEGALAMRRERTRFGPWGLEGGGNGPLCRQEVRFEDGRTQTLPGKARCLLRPGDSLRFWTTGSGGYGCPLTRDPDRVLDDVLNGRVSAEAAHDSYGVVIENQTLNSPATEALRRQLQASQDKAEPRA